MNSKQSINVFVNYHKYSIFQESSDINYARYFKCLENSDDTEDRVINVYFNENRISALVSDFCIILLNSNKLKKLIQLRKFIFPVILLLSRHSIIFPWQLKSIDIIITHWFFPIKISNHKIPIIFSSGFPSNQYVGVTSTQERESEIELRKQWFSKSDIVTFPATTWIHDFLKIDSSFKNKIVFQPRILPNTYPIDRITMKQKFDNRNPIKILFVGRDGIRKGLEDFLDALKIIKKKINTETLATIKVIIVTASKVEVIDGLNMTILSPLPNSQTVELMRQAHIFCLPTRKDSYGLVFLEAMASGCAIIADNKHPRTEFLDQGCAGLLVHNHKIDIAEALLKLILEWNFTEQLAQRALEKFIKTYEFKNAINGYLKLIDRLLPNS